MTKHQTPSKSETMKKNTENRPQQATNTQSEPEKSKNSQNAASKMQRQPEEKRIHSTWSPYMDSIVSIPEGMSLEQFNHALDETLYCPSETAGRFPVFEEIAPNKNEIEEL